MPYNVNSSLNLNRKQARTLIALAVIALTLVIGFGLLVIIPNLQTPDILAAEAFYGLGTIQSIDTPAPQLYDSLSQRLSNSVNTPSVTYIVTISQIPVSLTPERTQIPLQGLTTFITPTFTGSSNPSPTQPLSLASEPSEALLGTFENSPATAFEEQIIIGSSVGGRPIIVYRFGNGPIQRMVVAGIHGGVEWNTIALARELIDHVRLHPGVVPAPVTLFILPSLNPDGEARGHIPAGRTNDHNVDLNRNWDAGWRADWPRMGCWDIRRTTAGVGPGSEPETQALMGFLQDHHVSALINFHSAGPAIYPSGSPPSPLSVDLAKTIATAADYPYPPVQTGCQYSGTLVDWALKQGTAGVDLEMVNHVSTDFENNLRVLQVLLNWQPPEQ